MARSYGFGFQPSFVICLALALSSSAFAKDYYISKQNGRDGNDGTSPDKASSGPVALFVTHKTRLGRGDRVFFGPGTYGRAGYFTIGYLDRTNSRGTRTQPIRMIADPECRILKKDQPGRVVLNGHAYLTVNLEGVSYVNLEGFTIANRTQGGTGVGVRASHGNIIKNCEFINPPGRSNLMSVGMYVLSGSCSIRNCRFTDLSSMGIYCRNNSRTTIEDCTFRKIGLRAVGCWQQNAYLVLRRSRFFDNQEAVYFDPPRGGIIENCWITGSKRDAIITSNASGSIFNCTINHNPGNAIRLESGYQRIRNRLTVQNCLIAHNGGVGLNHVARNKYGASTARMVHSNNLLWNNKGGNFTSISPKHPTEIVADPKLRITDNRPGLQDDSPAINEARTLFYIRTDMLRRPRPAGGGSDIGAIEADAHKRPTTYYITRGGSDRNPGDSPRESWGTIRHAFRQLHPGDTLYIGAGSYRGDVSAILRGTSDRPIRVIGDSDGAQTGNSGAVVIQGRRRWNLYLTGGHVELKNIELRTTGYSNLRLHAETPVSLHNCSLIGGTNYTALTVGSVTLERCVIDSRWGINHHNPSPSEDPYLRLIQCRIRCSNYAVFGVDYAANSGSPIGEIATVSADRCVFEAGSGFSFQGVKGVVSNCLLMTKRMGIYFYNSLTGSGAWNNTFVGADANEGIGILMNRDGRATLTNNIIVRYKTGIYGIGLRFKCLQRSNLLFNNKQDLLLNSSFNMSREVIKSEPMFADPAKQDFRLTARSPAIDAGIETVWMSETIDGRGALLDQLGR